MNINITIPIEELLKKAAAPVGTAIVPEPTYKVDDVLDFTLKTGEEVHAMAMKQEADGMIFCFIDCLKEERQMDDEDTNRYGFTGTNLCNWLNSELVNQFPDNIRAKMIPFNGSLYLRLPTEKETFGKNQYGKKEPDFVTQWEPMKIRRNRISFQGKNSESFAWPWLSTPAKDSAAGFADVGGNGDAACDGASYSRGVRPAFKIRNL